MSNGITTLLGQFRCWLGKHTYYNEYAEVKGLPVAIPLCEYCCMTGDLRGMTAELERIGKLSDFEIAIEKMLNAEKDPV